jgi:hypothetical protein
MKTIEISDELYNSLIELSKELNTQNNRGTATPYFFQIQSQERVAVPLGCGKEAWRCDDSLIETEEEIINAIFDYKDESMTKDEIKELSSFDKEEMLELIGYERVNYDYKESLENAFLTEKACKEHIRANKHHYNQPVNYLSHAFRNPELELVLKFLSELTINKT